MEKTFKRNFFWVIAAVFAVIAVFTNPDHLWSASIIFALGCIQMEDDRETEDK